MQKAKSKLPAAKAAGNVKHANDVFNQVSLLWQLGDWQALSAFDQADFDASSNAGYCYLYVAIANFQLSDSAAGKVLISKAIAAGVEPTTATKMLLSSVYNNFGNMAFLNQNEPAAMANYQHALQLLNGFEPSKSHLNTRVKNQLELIAQGTDAAFKRRLVNQSYYFNALDYRNLVFDTLYLTPKYYDSPVSTFLLPVAYWLVAALKPNSVISLATDSAAFHFAICQALVNSSEELEYKKLYLDTSLLDNETLSQAEGHQKKWYSGLSSFLSRTELSEFSEAVANTIDLLTIDCCQTMQQLISTIAKYRTHFSDKACVLVATQYFHFDEALLSDVELNGWFSFDLDKKLVLLDFSKGCMGPIQQLCALQQNYAQKFEFLRIVKYFSNYAIKSYSDFTGYAISPEAKTTELQLFLPHEETGAYSEINSIKTRVELDQWQTISIPFQCSKKHKLRFDPCSAISIVNFEYFFIKNAFTDNIIFELLHDNEFSGIAVSGTCVRLSNIDNNYTLFSFGNDPIMIIEKLAAENDVESYYLETKILIQSNISSVVNLL
ncbi:hypothetical protein [Alishewanella tabrizica]|uniref:Uncharacterized protein n=1 Tax=Alishewanella tabrizica TaxID=671278 RepID=A0ABQ2WBR3_9ALTE|nr:hypothetical protein [Alishewanella tabrizica]GGW48443.1 hypothetical protein GCM10008111_00050 [Alishewanella tabrizica]